MRIKAELLTKCHQKMNKKMLMRFFDGLNLMMTALYFAH